MDKASSILDEDKPRSAGRDAPEGPDYSSFNALVERRSSALELILGFVWFRSSAEIAVIITTTALAYWAINLHSVDAALSTNSLIGSLAIGLMLTVLGVTALIFSRTRNGPNQENRTDESTKPRAKRIRSRKTRSAKEHNAGR